MFNSVDYIGVESVANLIKQADLKRFIIYRQGAAKGSTPVFDCSYTTNNAAAIKSFKDWAENMCRFNPNNFLSYDILLFNDFEEGMDEQNRNPAEERTTGRKKGKIRFSFCLNATGQHQQQNNFGGHGMGIDIAGEIQKGIDMAMLRHENNQLKQQIKELEEDDEEEEEESDDLLAKMVKSYMIQKNLETSDTISGDELEGMTDNKTKKKNLHGFTDEQVKAKTESVNKALKILWKHNKQLDVDLLKLAKLAEEDPEVFKLVLAKLKAF